MKANKNFKNLEKIMKGAANHWRLKILFLLDEEPGLSLFDIADKLNGNFKTISEHTRKLVQSDLIQKKYQFKTVLHSVSPLGRRILHFVENLEV